MFSRELIGSLAWRALCYTRILANRNNWRLISTIEKIWEREKGDHGNRYVETRGFEFFALIPPIHRRNNQIPQMIRVILPSCLARIQVAKVTWIQPRRSERSDPRRADRDHSPSVFCSQHSGVVLSETKFPDLARFPYRYIPVWSRRDASIYIPAWDYAGLCTPHKSERGGLLGWTAHQIAF